MGTRVPGWCWRVKAIERDCNSRILTCVALVYGVLFSVGTNNIEMLIPIFRNKYASEGGLRIHSQENTLGHGPVSVLLIVNQLPGPHPLPSLGVKSRSPFFLPPPKIAHRTTTAKLSILSIVSLLFFFCRSSRTLYWSWLCRRIRLKPCSTPITY